MSTNKRAALGKGLSALIATADKLGNIGQSINDNALTADDTNPKPAGPASISEIPIEKISANPYQPRSYFDETALAELCDSIRQYGIIQPITVRRIGLKYQIISGERRFKAAKAAGLQTVPAYIKETDDQGMLEMAIVENIQRENLDAIEVAISFQRLIEECNLTQEVMAERVGKNRTTVTNYLRLLKLPVEIQVCIRDKHISMGHAKAILYLSEPEQQLELCEMIMRKGMSVRQTEAKAQSMLKNEEKKDRPATAKSAEPRVRFISLLNKYIGGKHINVTKSETETNSITLSFSTSEDMEAFLKEINEK